MISVINQPNHAMNAKLERANIVGLRINNMMNEQEERGGRGGE